MTKSSRTTRLLSFILHLYHSRPLHPHRNPAAVVWLNLLLPNLLCCFCRAATQPPPENWPDHIQTVLEHTQPLTHDRSDRLPLYLWQAMDPGPLTPHQARTLLKLLDQRGIALITSWNPAKSQQSLERSLTIAKAQKQLGLRVNINATSCLYHFFNGDPATAHIDANDTPFWDSSFGEQHKIGCPFTLQKRRAAIRQQIQPFLKAFEDADIPIGFIFADWEIDGPIEWNHAHDAAKKCRRCRQNIPDINDFTRFQASLRTLRADLQRTCFAQPVLTRWPDALVGNYGVYPHAGYHYWYDYYEYYVPGQPAQNDHNAKYRKWFHEFPLTSYTCAMPVVYPWDRIAAWYDIPDLEFCYFYNMLLAATNAAQSTSPDVPIIAFVHWHTISTKYGPENPGQISAEMFKELLWHMLLRGIDTFFLWCPNNQAAEEIPLVHQVYAEAQAFGRFLSQGTPISFTIPRTPQPVISGLRLGNEVLIRRTDFTKPTGPVGLAIGNRRFRIQPSPGRCQIIHLR